MRQQNIKTPVIFRISLVLLCVWIFSFYLTGGLYARYTSSASDSDSARVARFIFDVEKNAGSSEFIDVSEIQKPGDSIEYSFTVSNGTPDKCCEVVQNYSIKLTVEGNMPLVCTLNGTPLTDEGYSDALSAGVYDCKEFTLKIEWPKEKNEETLSNGVAVGLLTLTITSQQAD